MPGWDPLPPHCWPAHLQDSLEPSPGLGAQWWPLRCCTEPQVLSRLQATMPGTGRRGWLPLAG